MARRTFDRRRGPIGLAAAAALVAAGCTAGGEMADTEGGGEGAEPVHGGELISYVVQEIFSFDPAAVQTFNYGSQGGFMQSMYDVLVYVDRDDNTVKGMLAESLEPVEGSDCEEWLLTLKPDLEFTDGTPLDAEAVQFNYERIQDPEVASPQLPNIADAEFEVLSDTELQMTPAAQNCSFDRLIANNLPFIGSPTAIEELGEDYGQEPVGAGPFMMSEWDQATGDVTLEANPDYHLDDRPYLDALTFTQETAGSTTIDTIAAGQAHLTGGTQVVDAVDQAEDAGLQYDLLPTNGGGSYQYNTAREPFDELCAREFVAYGLDPAAVDEALNTSELTGGPEPYLFSEDSEFYDPDVEFPHDDPDLAQEALDECEGDGVDMEFSIVALPGPDQELAEYVSSRLNEYDGVQANVEIVSAADAFTQIFQERQFDLTSYPGGMRFTDPEPLFTNWVHSEGTINLPEYGTEEMDTALAELRAATDEDDRIAAAQEVQRIWTEDLPYWIYSSEANYFIYPDNVTGVTPINGGNDFLLMQEIGFTDVEE